MIWLLRNIMKWSVFFTLVAFIVLALYAWVQRPSHEREWQEYVAILPHAEVTDETVTLYNVRNWHHDATGVTSRDYIEKVELNLSELEHAWFIVQPFSKWEGVGHTFVSFEFSDGSTYAFSVEARREVDEAYTAFWGLFNSYELIYSWGTERDFLGSRLFLLQDPLRMYPLALSQADAAAVLKTLARETAVLHENPRFYNTLTANCTNILAKAINARYPSSLPYDLSWNFPGYSDRYLIDQGFIQTDDNIAVARSRAALAPHTVILEQAASESPHAFSAMVRKVLQQVHTQ